MRVISRKLMPVNKSTRVLLRMNCGTAPYSGPCREPIAIVRATDRAARRIKLWRHYCRWCYVNEETRIIYRMDNDSLMDCQRKEDGRSEKWSESHVRQMKYGHVCVRVLKPGTDTECLINCENSQKETRCHIGANIQIITRHKRHRMIWNRLEKNIHFINFLNLDFLS